MRRVNREINVFNLSAIDLFASAMGAFMLISLVALPYYLDDDYLSEQIAQLTADNERIQAETDEANRALVQARQRTREERQRLQRIQQQAQQQQQTIQNLEERLAKNILVVMINWYTSADIDLHVVTPTGHHYSYRNPNRRAVGGGGRTDWPGEEAELSFDAGSAIVGDAGIEVWTMADAPAGNYAVSVDKYAKNRDHAPTRVEIAILSGNRVERQVVERLEGSRDVATVRVEANGEVAVTWR